MPDTPVGPGTVLAGRFVLEDLVADTEGARFWRATDKILARSVAVHVIDSSDPRAAGLLSAARTSATVTDGHLLRVLDAATADDVTYVVNEWGHGMSLDRLLAEGPLSPRRAAWVAKEVAEAISTAHRAGIAHGRLLPENVMVTESGSVKLIGFVVDAVLQGRDTATVRGEQTLEEHEADVVNLGALLYAGLVGRWPGTDGSVIPAAPVEHGRPLRPRQVRAGVPRPLDAICERVLGGNGHGVVPLETAHEVYAALCDYVGDPTAAPLGDTGPMPAVDGDTGEQPGEATQLSPGPLVETGDVAGANGGDPERTQVGVPRFDDDAADADDPDGPAAPSGDGPESTRVVRTAPPPPPPFPEPEERPLFASDAPRRPRDTDPLASTPATYRTATHATIPPAWGPDADTPPPAGGRRRADVDEPPGRSWLRLAAALAGVLVLVLAIVFAFNLGRGSVLPGGDDEAQSGTQTEGASKQTPKPVEVASVSDFDPPPGGNGEENAETAPLAVDGNPTTAWRTSTYYDPLSLQKPGVGLLVDLGKAVDVSDVQLTLIGQGTDVELRAAPGADAAPTALAQTERVAAAAGAGTDVTLAPKQAVKTRFLLVWLTDLPTVDGGYRGEVAEIGVRA
ncbi:protein kinase family protein [Nocardioides iriomotensis]|uniref:Protein kinase domain-containing protein n=1 Tax=Nocardioides iriomotensis TaxID=715784 RepID=A0A4Q5IYA5_9ACTN|nr:protein kinase family protein [Nocardioides iriomotensis]RYU10228.1 hypothetical protein ETU37_17675 [Nocardioides iriomotensis]